MATTLTVGQTITWAAATVEVVEIDYTNDLFLVRPPANTPEDNTGAIWLHEVSTDVYELSV